MLCVAAAIVFSGCATFDRAYIWGYELVHPVQEGDQ